MEYQNPQLLYFLFAIAIPILIHLINLRKYKVFHFSSIRFLKEIQEKRKKRSELKNILILCSRILAIIFLVLAFAKPYFPANKNNQNKHVVLYIDNSFSMNSFSNEGRLLDVAKQIATSIIHTYPEESKFYLITNEFKANHTRSFNKESMEELISKVENSGFIRTSDEIISRARILKKNKVNMYLISDMQKSTVSFEEINDSDSASNYYLLPIRNKNIKNVGIDSVWLSSPIYTQDRLIQLSVRVKNYSVKSIEDIPIIVKVNNQQKSQQLISMDEKEIKEITFDINTNKNKFQEGIVILEDNSVNFDDKYYFSFHRKRKANILLIYQYENPEIQALFEGDSALFNFEKMHENQIKYEEIKVQDFIILDGLKNITSGLKEGISSFVENGGNISIVPPDNINFSVYKEWLNAMGLDYYTGVDTTTYELNKINQEHPLFSYVFEGKVKSRKMPTIFQHYTLSENNIGEKLYVLENKDSYINQYNLKGGKVYLFTTPFNKIYQNFSKHALFVPTLINMATHIENTKRLYYVIGRDYNLEISKENQDIKIPHLKSKDVDIIPEIRTVLGDKKLFIHTQITKANHYNLTEEDQKKASFAFNYNMKESELTCLTVKEIQQLLNKQRLENFKILSGSKNQINTSIKKIHTDKQYWRLALVLSLLFLILELILLKLFKS